MTARPRVLFLNNQGLGSMGGGVTILRHLVAELAPDHEIVVASQSPPATAPEGVRQVELAPYMPSPNWRIAPLARAAQTHKLVPPDEIESADAVVTLDCHFSTAIARSRPRALVYLSLSCMPRQEWFGNEGAGAVWAFAQYAWLERRIARAADAVVVASEMHARELRRFEALPNIRIEVIRPVFADVARPLVYARSERSWFNLVAAGRMVPGKGYARLLDMMLGLRDIDCRLVIVGDGPDAPLLAARAADLGIADRVRIEPARTSLDALLADADIFLHPSRYESFGIAVFEAMQAGVPPVCDAMAVGGYREFVTDTVDGLFVRFDDPVGAAAEVRGLLLDARRRRAMARAARLSTQVRAEDDHARRFRTLLERLLTSRRPQ